MNGGHSISAGDTIMNCILTAGQKNRLLTGTATQTEPLSAASLRSEETIPAHAAAGKNIKTAADKTNDSTKAASTARTGRLPFWLLLSVSLQDTLFLISLDYALVSFFLVIADSN